MSVELKAAQERAMKYAKDNLKECAVEMIEWKDTGISRDGQVRELARLVRDFAAGRDTLPIAESLVNRAALESAAAA